MVDMHHSKHLWAVGALSSYHHWNISILTLVSVINCLRIAYHKEATIPFIGIDLEFFCYYPSHICFK